MTIIYVHGLGSGKNSRTGEIIERVFNEDNVIRAELPIKPKDAVEYLLQMYREYYRHSQCITADMGHRLSEEDIINYIVPLVNKIRGL